MLAATFALITLSMLAATFALTTLSMLGATFALMTLSMLAATFAKHAKIKVGIPRTYTAKIFQRHTACFCHAPIIRPIAG